MMSSVELRAYAAAHNRPDLALHADCVAERERLDSLSEDMEALNASVRNLPLPNGLKDKIHVVNLYLLTGCWEGHYPYPEDGITAEVERLEAAVAAAGFVVPFAGAGHSMQQGVSTEVPRRLN